MRRIDWTMTAILSDSVIKNPFQFLIAIDSIEHSLLAYGMTVIGLFFIRSGYINWLRDTEPAITLRGHITSSSANVNRIHCYEE